MNIFNAMKRDYYVLYLTSYGSMCIHTNMFKCKAFSKRHAHSLFREGTKNADHYADRTYIASFAAMLAEGDIMTQKEYDHFLETHEQF